MTAERESRMFSRERSRRVLWIVFTVLISLGLFVWIVSKLDLQEFSETMRATNWWWAAGAYAATALFQVWRALRTRLVLSQPIPLPLLYATMCLHATIRNLAPSWLGELGFMWLLKKLHGVELTRATAVLATQRLFDVAIIVGGASLVVVFSSLEQLDRKLQTALGAALAVGLSIVALGIGGIFVARWLSPDSLDDVKDGASQGLMGRIATRVKQASFNTLWHVREVSRLHLLPMIGLYSILMWCSLYVAFICYMKALGSGLMATQVLWLFLLVMPINLLPVRGVANIGTHEAAWFLALTFLGIEAAQAVILAVGSHVLMLISVAVLFALGMGIRLICKKAKFDNRTLQQAYGRD